MQGQTMPCGRASLGSGRAPHHSRPCVQIVTDDGGGAEAEHASRAPIAAAAARVAGAYEL